MPCLSLRQTRLGVSHSTVSCWGIPNMSGSKSSGRGSPLRERKIEAYTFSYVFTCCELPLFPYFSLLFPFSCFRCCGFCANLICRLIFSHPALSKSSTRCNTFFSTPDLIWCRFSLIVEIVNWQLRPVLSLPPSVNRLSICLIMFSVMAWSLSTMRFASLLHGLMSMS